MSNNKTYKDLINKANKFINPSNGEKSNYTSALNQFIALCDLEINDKQTYDSAKLMLCDKIVTDLEQNKLDKNQQISALSIIFNAATTFASLDKKKFPDAHSQATKAVDLYIATHKQICFKKTGSEKLKYLNRLLNEIKGDVDLTNIKEISSHIANLSKYIKDLEQEKKEEKATVKASGPSPYSSSSSSSYSSSSNISLPQEKDLGQEKKEEKATAKASEPSQYSSSSSSSYSSSSNISLPQESTLSAFVCENQLSEEDQLYNSIIQRYDAMVAKSESPSSRLSEMFDEAQQLVSEFRNEVKAHKEKKFNSIKSTSLLSPATKFNLSYKLIRPISTPVKAENKLSENDENARLILHTAISNFNQGKKPEEQVDFFDFIKEYQGEKSFDKFKGLIEKVQETLNDKSFSSINSDQFYNSIKIISDNIKKELMPTPSLSTPSLSTPLLSMSFSPAGLSASPAFTKSPALTQRQLSFETPISDKQEDNSLRSVEKGDKNPHIQNNKEDKDIFGLDSRSSSFSPIAASSSSPLKRKSETELNPKPDFRSQASSPKKQIEHS